MKNLFSKAILLLTLLATTLAQAQQRNCSAMDNLETRKLADPSLEARMNQIESYTQQKANQLLVAKAVNGSIISIPVVVHVVYNTAQQNISDAQIQSQIDVLNEDFRRTNGDRDNVWSQAADMQIEFCLAQTDPNGVATNGITRKSSTRTSWGTNDDVKKLSQGGVNPWDTSQYLNMWVANIGGSLLGYAQFPGGAASTDGVVMSPQFFGSSDKGNGFFLSAPFDKGRTTTHEVGHFLNLRHIWGDGGCNVDDFVTDTPTSDASNGGCNIGHVSCGSVDMVQNYMDYSDDGCMNLFTVGQKARMRASLLSGGPRASLANSTKCNAPTGGGGNTGCSSTIASFPYNAGFENTFDGWTQSASDDFDWALNSGGTPSASTGPSAAAQGTFYIYVEASSPNSPSKTTILNSPCYNFTGITTPNVSFKYQMTGNAVGSVRLEAKESSASTWSQVWSASGDQGAAWKDAAFTLTGLGNKTVQLRFVGTTGTSWQGDIAIDAFAIAGAPAGDTQSPTTPLSLSASGTTQTATSLSWNASTDNVGVTGYDVFQDNVLLGSIATPGASITGLTANTTYVFKVRAKDAAGNLSAFSNNVSVSTLSNAACTNGITSFPYAESFENTLGAWTQDGTDTLDWTLRSGTTPSSGTGPSGAAAGTFYVYVEASDPNFNKTARLNSPCLDLSTLTAAFVTFQYQMTGNAAGTLSLEASNNNGASYTSVFTKSGNQGAAWQTASVDLSAYTGGAARLRLVVNTTGSWQGDIAVDDLKISSSSAPADKCAGVAAYNASQSYSVGDRVTYQGFLYERAASAWNNLGACGTARSQEAAVSIPEASIVTIYPNPVRAAYLSIAGIDGKASYVVFNINGQKIQSGVVENNMISVENLKANMYLLQLTTATNTTTLKFVKE